MLLLKYAVRGFALLFAIVVGVFLMIYISQQRSTWFRLGKFKTSLKDVKGYLSMKPVKTSKDHCCYCQDAWANGKPIRIELLKTLDIKIRSYGALNHVAKYKNRVKRVVISRSMRAQFFHRMATLLKLASMILCLMLLPFESLLWRIIAGMVTGGMFLVVCTLKNKHCWPGVQYTPPVISILL